jgi:hypothetical protein
MVHSVMASDMTLSSESNNRVHAHHQCGDDLFDNRAPFFHGPTPHSLRHNAPGNDPVALILVAAAWRYHLEYESLNLCHPKPLWVPDTPVETQVTP